MKAGVFARDATGSGYLTASPQKAGELNLSGLPSTVRE